MYSVAFSGLSGLNVRVAARSIPNIPPTSSQRNLGRVIANSSAPMSSQVREYVSPSVFVPLVVMTADRVGSVEMLD